MHISEELHDAFRVSGCLDVRWGCNHACLIGPLRIIALGNSNITQLLLVERPRAKLHLEKRKTYAEGGRYGILNIKGYAIILVTFKVSSSIDLVNDD